MLKIPNHKSELKNKKIAIYNKPEYVYIPLVNGSDTDITVLVKKGDYVYKGTHLGKRKGNIKIPIISTVSGKVIDFVAKPYMNGLEVKCVKIENDFKEKCVETKNYEKINKEAFLELLHDNGIIGLGGAGFPTHIKYDNKEIKYLLVNAVECEPYITADYEVLKTHTEEILEGIDMILEINNIDEAIIAVKKSNVELIKILNNFIGTYLKIKIKEVPNLYPMGWERTLIKEVFNETYENLPIEKGIVVNNVSTIFAIYRVLKYNEPFTERVVTFAGNGFKKPQNILVKIGTQASEVINSVIGYKKVDEVNFIAGGPMMGESISTDDLIISPNLNSVLVLKNTHYKEIECLRCGKCIDVCPANICPVLIKDSINNVEKLKTLDVSKCVSCGLCSYICPSKIQVREYVKKAKEKIKESDNNENNK